MMKKKSKIYVAGEKTFIGAAILSELKRQAYSNICEERGERLDLTESSQVEIFFKKERPEYVFLTAGKSGGIEANQKYPAEFMIDNLLIETNLVKNAHKYGVKKLLYVASSCSYPKNCSQPMRENALLTGPLEETNEAYALAKIAGIKLCQSFCRQYGVKFISVISANVFGLGDDFSFENSHVIAALIGKMHKAKIRGEKSVRIWGTGRPRREFIFADDFANACIFVLKHYDDALPINIGSGISFSIRELAEHIREIVGFEGELIFDKTKPDGMPVKILDNQKLKNLGWKTKWVFEDALKTTYEWFKGREQEAKSCLEKNS